MRIALLADPHANVFALDSAQRVLRDTAPDLVVCLGDVVGYNANPGEVTDRIREICDVVVKGNHDVDATRGAVSSSTNAAARIAQEWTKGVLTAAQAAYLLELPRIAVRPEGFVAVHGCFMNDLYYTGYVTGTMVGYNLARVASREDLPTLAFCGHTHQPMCAYQQLGEVTELRPEGECSWPANAEAVLINPGSVGQPRDGDPRAAVAIVDLDARRVRFVRVEYPIASAQGALRAAGLPQELSDRLATGR
jgi:predicted phosphodiesterase